MLALRAHAGRGPQDLVLERVPVPKLGIGDVLLRVHAASFTPTELTWPSTWEDRAGHPRAHPILGHEVSGVVVALGYGTTGLAVGDEVYGLTDWYRDGAVAEYVAAEARNVAPKPGPLDHVPAAAASLAGLTAWQALFEHGKLQADDTVLIHGAGGGVGAFAVQLAHQAGAHVIATGRSGTAGLARELGADRFVDSDRQRFEDEVGPVDLVIDAVGGDVLTRSVAVIRPGGALISIVSSPTPDEVANRDVHALFFVVEPNRSALQELAGRMTAGEIRAIVGEVVPLAQAPEAFQTKQRSGIPGKVVLRVAE